MRWRIPPVLLHTSSAAVKSGDRSVNAAPRRRRFALGPRRECRTLPHERQWRDVKCPGDRPGGSEDEKVVDVPTVMILRKGQPVSKYPLIKTQTSIGRRIGNDIVLNGWSVSGSHAVLIQDGAQVMVQDLGSRNGTFVDGVRIERAHLQDLGVVRIADFTLTLEARRAAMAYEPTLVVRSASPARLARLERLDGADAGEFIALSQTLTTLGQPEVCEVTCIRRADDFAVKFASGTSPARLNGAVLGETPVRLYDRDILELGCGNRLQFQIGKS